MNFLDLFARKLREKRELMKVTQRGLAEKLGMCNRTIIEIEGCKSSPRFETVALIAQEMNISLDPIVFHDTPPQEIPKCASDFFAGKSGAEAQRYIALCRQADAFRQISKGDCSETAVVFACKEAAFTLGNSCHTEIPISHP